MCASVAAAQKKDSSRAWKATSRSCSSHCIASKLCKSSPRSHLENMPMLFDPGHLPETQRARAGPQLNEAESQILGRPDRQISKQRVKVRQFRVHLVQLLFSPLQRGAILRTGRGYSDSPCPRQRSSALRSSWPVTFQPFLAARGLSRVAPSDLCVRRLCGLPASARCRGLRHQLRYAAGSYQASHSARNRNWVVCLVIAPFNSFARSSGASIFLWWANTKFMD